MPADLAAARAFYSELDAALRKVPVYTYDTRLSHRAERDAAISALEALITSRGGAVKSDWQGARLRLFGLSASSTSGIEGACRNWMAQVTLKSAMAGAA